MGFYIRKSKSHGPFRFNFSKSGVGVSTGVKGARLSIGPNGTYVNVGRNGIYYRKKIGTSSTTQKNPNKASSYSPAFNYENNDSYTDAIKVSPFSEGNYELGENIIKNIKRAKIIRWSWLILSVLSIVFIAWWTLIPMLIIRLIFQKVFNAVIKYDFDSNASLEWDKFSEVLSLLKTCNKLWIIEKTKHNTNAKYSAGVTRNISRIKATVKKIKPGQETGFKIKTDASSVLIKSQKCSMLFLPSDIVIKKGTKCVSYSYDQMTEYSSFTRFVETSTVPRDAEIIDYTWKYVNKNGTADKRFNNNKQIPVCRYGVIHFNVGQDLHIELHASNRLATENVDNAYQLYRSYVNQIELVPTPPEEECEKNPSCEDTTEKEDLYSKSNSDKENSLIDDMSMFLKED